MARSGAGPLTAAARAVAGLRARLAGRPDTEHEQAGVRLANAVLFGLYLLPSMLDRETAGLYWAHMLVWMAYLLAGIAIWAAIFRHPGMSPARRVAGAIADIGTLTWCLVQYGEPAAPLFVAYLWITLANGFRFGARYLMVALGLSVAGFMVVLTYGEFWVGHPRLGIGLMIAMIALSIYVRSLVRKLFDAIARAEAANQAKRRFISVVSHEMRTPLNAIIGMADLLRETTLNREQTDMLQTLRSSSRIMLGLVDDVLDFSKIEAGKVVLEKRDFDLHALINSTSRILAAQAGAKGIDFIGSIMPEVPPAVSGDPHYLRQVLINLAGNAIKFTERGSVTVHVSAQNETAASVRLKVSIRDTGIGIAPEAQARIFESFTQADQSTTRRFGGTGLGTTIAKQLVDLMGGRIGLESAVGLGTTFWFELDLGKQPERTGVRTGELTGARVLLVGFPAGECESLEQALVGWGATPVVVAGIKEGIARLDAEISLAKPYQSAILYAPGADPRLAERFRRAAPEPAPPTVLAVPRNAAVPRFEMLSSGFAAVLELPFEKRQLFNVLHSVSASEEVREGVVRLQDYAARTGSARKLRVLVADDNPTNREVVSRILERGGHSVTLVSDGEKALEAVEAEEPDVVILDRNMPGMSGMEALQALRLVTRERTRLPVIIFSADVTPETKREALAAGADAFLGKPVEAVRLLDEVQSLAGAREARQAEAPATGRRRRAADEQQVVNIETLGHLEQLGSSAAFLERLVGVFTEDCGGITRRMEPALAGRNYGEFRSLLHALKGSSASMGTDRLTGLCSQLWRLSDSELRLQAPGLLRPLNEELASACDMLRRHLKDRQHSAG
jgi:two-component system, sensor histidine kinase RpfC